MKPSLGVSLSAAVLLTACVAQTGGDTVPVRDTAPSTPQTSEEVANFNGRTYRIEVAADRQTALVGIPSGRGTFTGADIEGAAMLATQCSATIVPGEWAILGDLRPFDLSNLRPEVRSPFPAWQVSLSC